MEDEARETLEQPMEGPKTYTQEEVDSLQGEWARKLQDSQLALKQQTIKHTFYQKATESGIRNVEGLLKYVDLSGIEIAEGGEVAGLEEMIATLSSISPTRSEPKTIGAPTAYPQSDRTRDSILKEAADKARKSGRTEDRAAFSSLKQRLFGGK
ncbi:hypothetical protein ABE137_10255 [Brevibacillus laterosporus]|uniref:hypothetical protein n=1 Tax=Brevibacillus laterosporus TaxID=1465 RepID=UPI003D25C8DA